MTSGKKQTWLSDCYSRYCLWKTLSICIVDIVKFCGFLILLDVQYVWWILIMVMQYGFFLVYISTTKNVLMIG